MLYIYIHQKEKETKIIYKFVLEKTITFDHSVRKKAEKFITKIVSSSIGEKKIEIFVGLGIQVCI